MSKHEKQSERKIIERSHLDQVELLSGSELGCQLHRPLPLLVLHLVPPESVLVEDSEAVDNYWYGQSQDKYA